MRTCTDTADESASILREACIIDASAERIWSALTDFGQYHRWNPFLVSVAGALSDCSLTVTARLSFLPPVSFSARLRPSSSCSFLGWDARFAAGLFSAFHWFTIQPIAEARCLFVQAERFSGLLSKPVVVLLEQQFRVAYRLMNEALKHEVERL